MAWTLNATETEEVSMETTEETSLEYLGSSGMIQPVSNYGAVLSAIGVAVALTGVILNSIVIDMSERLGPQTSGSKWMKYLASWDSLVLLLTISFFGPLVLKYTPINNMSDWTCKFYSFTSNVCVMNSSGHLVAMAVDRALNMAYPTWHYNKPWTKINIKVSIGILSFFCVVNAPVLLWSEIVDGSCQYALDFELLAKLHRVFVVAYLFMFNHFSLVVFASVAFVYQLKKRRRAGGKKKDPPGLKSRQNATRTSKSVVKHAPKVCDHFALW